MPRNVGLRWSYTYGRFWWVPEISNEFKSFRCIQQDVVVVVESSTSFRLPASCNCAHCFLDNRPTMLVSCSAGSSGAGASCPKVSLSPSRCLPLGSWAEVCCKLLVFPLVLSEGETYIRLTLRERSSKHPKTIQV